MISLSTYQRTKSINSRSKTVNRMALLKGSVTTKNIAGIIATTSIPHCFDVTNPLKKSGFTRKTVAKRAPTIAVIKQVTITGVDGFGFKVLSLELIVQGLILCK